MLKSYQEFLTSINESHDQIPDRFDKFLTDVLNFSKYETSFSYLAKNRTTNDIVEIDNFIEKISIRYSDLNLKELIEKHTNYVYDKLGTKENGATDIIFNHFSKKFPLSGGLIIDDPDTLIKYLYGWHHTKYGMMAILESFKTIEDYYDYVEKGINDDQEYISPLNGVEQVKDNYIIGKYLKKEAEHYKHYNVDLFRKDLKVVDSEITPDSIIVLRYPNSNKEYDANDKNIVDFLIKNDMTKYLSVLDIDSSHVDDEYIKSISSVPKNVKKFNL